MIEKVKNYISENNMITKGDRIVVGVSAGPDSVCLLNCLLRLKDELGFEIFIVHVNHGIRDSEALRDERFVEQIAKEYGIKCRTYRYDVPSISSAKGMSHEEAGRYARRIAFDDFINTNSCNKIALAHNMNDQAETVLLNLCRGTGLTGIAGILPVKDNIIRPLLGISRKEIEAFLKENDIAFMTDSTNLGDEYTRNKIRHNVLPYLEKEINSGAVRNIARAAMHVRDAEKIINDGTAVNAEDNLVFEPGKVLVKNRAFETDLAVYVIREALKYLTPHLKDITADHISMVEKISKQQVGKRASLPYEIMCERSYDGVLLIRNIGGCPVNDLVVNIKGNGIYKFDKYEIKCEILDKVPESIPEKIYTKWVDYDKMKGAVIRTRRPADRIVITDQGSKKKISDFMIDRKIPRSDRDSIPLIAVESDVVWIPGYRLSSKYKITESTKNVMKIDFRNID